eukprot:jgi/Mesvir1/18657/Mv25670-RA.2
MALRLVFFSLLALVLLSGSPLVIAKSRKAVPTQEHEVEHLQWGQKKQSQSAPEEQRKSKPEEQRKSKRSRASHSLVQDQNQVEVMTWQPQLEPTLYMPQGVYSPASEANSAAAVPYQLWQQMQGDPSPEGTRVAGLARGVEAASSRRRKRGFADDAGGDTAGGSGPFQVVEDDASPSMAGADAPSSSPFAGADAFSGAAAGPGDDAPSIYLENPFAAAIQQAEMSRQLAHDQAVAMGLSQPDGGLTPGERFAQEQAELAAMVAEFDRREKLQRTEELRPRGDKELPVGAEGGRRAWARALSKSRADAAQGADASGNGGEGSSPYDDPVESSQWAVGMKPEAAAAQEAVDEEVQKELRRLEEELMGVESAVSDLERHAPALSSTPLLDVPALDFPTGADPSAATPSYDAATPVPAFDAVAAIQALPSQVGVDALGSGADGAASYLSLVNQITTDPAPGPLVEGSGASTPLLDVPALGFPSGTDPSAAMPSDDVVTPVPVFDAATPVPMFDAATPVPAFDAVTPIPAFDAATPILAFDAATPVPAFDAATPVPAFDAATPVPAFDAATPILAFDAATPVPAFDAATPVPAFDAATPVPTFDAATPVPAFDAVPAIQALPSQVDVDALGSGADGAASYLSLVNQITNDPAPVPLVEGSGGGGGPLDPVAANAVLQAAMAFNADGSAGSPYEDLSNDAGHLVSPVEAAASMLALAGDSAELDTSGGSFAVNAGGAVADATAVPADIAADVSVPSLAATGAVDGMSLAATGAVDVMSLAAAGVDASGGADAVLGGGGTLGNIPIVTDAIATQVASGLVAAVAAAEEMVQSTAASKAFAEAEQEVKQEAAAEATQDADASITEPLSTETPTSDDSNSNNVGNLGPDGGMTGVEGSATPDKVSDVTNTESDHATGSVVAAALAELGAADGGGSGPAGGARHAPEWEQPALYNVVHPNKLPVLLLGVMPATGGNMLKHMLQEFSRHCSVPFLDFDKWIRARRHKLQHQAEEQTEETYDVGNGTGAFPISEFDEQVASVIELSAEEMEMLANIPARIIAGRIPFALRDYLRSYRRAAFLTVLDHPAERAVSFMLGRWRQLHGREEWMPDRRWRATAEECQYLNVMDDATRRDWCVPGKSDVVDFFRSGARSDRTLSLDDISKIAMKLAAELRPDPVYADWLTAAMPQAQQAARREDVVRLAAAAIRSAEFIGLHTDLPVTLGFLGQALTDPEFLGAGYRTLGDCSVALTRKFWGAMQRDVAQLVRPDMGPAVDVLKATWREALNEDLKLYAVAANVHAQEACLRELGPCRAGAEDAMMGWGDPAWGVVGAGGARKLLTRARARA